MNPSERAHMVLQSGGEPNHMEDWCGVFLDGLDGLEPSPTIERAAAAAAAAAAASRELLSPVDDETAFRRVRSVTEPHGSELMDKLGKRSRAALPESDAPLYTTYGGYVLHSSPLTPRFPGGGLGGPPSHGGLLPLLRTHRSGGAPTSMGPYRSASIQSIESTLSNHIDHALDDDGDELGDDVGGLVHLGAPPHKKGPASLPTAAPGLYRRAFSEGAQQDDHDVWQSASGEYGGEGSHLAGETKDDSNENEEWAIDGDGTDGDALGWRAGQKTAPWTRTEDQVISEAVKRFGCKWGVLAALLPGRTDNAVRNRWHRLERARKWREENSTRRQLGMSAFGADLDPAACEPPPMPVALAPAGPRTSGNGGYKCGRCGQPKRGHLCMVTLDSDQLVYEAAQDKMRELHLQQVDSKQPRPTMAMAMGRRKAPHVKEEPAQPQSVQPLNHHSLHHYQFVQHGMPLEHGLPQLQAMQPYQDASLSVAAQRQAAQRAQAQAQRQHQLAMQAQLQAHHAAQLATHAQQQQAAHAHPRAGTPLSHVQSYATQQATAIYGQEQLAHMALFGQATVLGMPTATKRSRAAELRHDAGSLSSGHPLSHTFAHVAPSRPTSGGSQSDQRAEIDLLAIKPDELLQIQSLLASHELDAGAGFELSGEQLDELQQAVDEDADCALSVFSDGRISVFIPPSIDRAISAPAGLLLDGNAQLGASRWPQTPGSKSKSLTSTSATGGSTVPSPTATAA